MNEQVSVGEVNIETLLLKEEPYDGSKGVNFMKSELVSWKVLLSIR